MKPITLHIVPAQGKAFEHLWTGQKLVVGRSRSSDLVIEDQEVSRQHARFYLQGDDLWVEDLRSHNGTWLNGRRLQQPEQLQHGTVIKLASSTVSIGFTEPGSQTDFQADTDSFRQLYKNASEILRDSHPKVDLLRDDNSLRRYADHLQLMNEVHASLSRPLSKEALLELILDRVMDYLKPEEAVIFLKQENGDLYPAAVRNTSDSGLALLHSSSLAEEVVGKGMAALVHDIDHDDRFQAAHSIITSGVRSLVAAPLLDSDQTLGMILLDSRGRAKQFNEDDMALLVSLGSIAALRIRNLGLMEEAARRLRDVNRMLEQKVALRTQALAATNDELETLDGMVRTINREVSLSKVLQTILDQGQTLFPRAERGLVFLRQKDRDRFTVVAARGYQMSQFETCTFVEADLRKRYIEDTETLQEGVYLIRNGSTGETPGPAGLQRPLSALILALPVNGTLAGLLVLHHTSQSDAFNQSDVLKLGRFREHAVTAVVKAHMMKELREKNEQILRTQNQLVMQEKMASLGTLTAGVAHEIRNPLNFVNNFASITLERFGELRQAWDKGDTHEWQDIVADLETNVRHIHQHGQRANQIVENMMELARGEVKKPQPCDINQMVTEYANLAYHGRRDRGHLQQLQMHLKTDPAVGKIEVVPQSLGRVILNLVSNAIDALFEKQTKQATPFQPSIDIATRALKERIEIVVRDNGPGIAKEHLHAIFTPFYTTKPGGSGNIGLGLSISYDIVNREHRGEIKVESTPGSWTEFTIVLPT